MKPKSLIASLLMLQPFLVCGEFMPQDSVLYADFECDGTFNNDDVAIPFTRIENESGQLLDITNSSGEFVMTLNAGIEYIISAEEIFGFSSTPLYINPDSDTLYSSNLAVCPESFINNLKIEVVPVFPASQGSDFRYDICVINLGTQADDVKVRFQPNLGDAVQVVDMDGAMLQGNAYVWDIDGLLPFQRMCFSIILHAADLSQGSAFSFSVNASYIDTGISDNFPSDNQILVNEVIQHDHAWNTKSVSRSEIDFLEIEIFESLPLDYEISFGLYQTDSLDHLTISDTLSPLLDLSSFEMISASHNYDFSIDENIITWTFPDLNFDLQQDSVLRSGLIRFRIQTINNPIITDTIFNSASFFADSIYSYFSNSTITSFYLCPEFVDIIGDAQFCASTGGNFIPAISEYDSFTWILDGNVISSNDSLVNLMTTAGDHELGLIIGNDACTVTGLLTIEAELPPTLELSEADISTCNEVSVSATSNATTSWFQGNNFILTGDTLIATSNGTYAAITTNTCGSNSEEISLVVPEGPTEVSIIDNDGVLSLTQEAIQYAWFLDESLLPNSNVPTWDANESGNYSALLQFASGCQMMTSAISLTIHITEEKISDFSIFPNPSSNGIVQFSFTGPILPERISIYDSQGRFIKDFLPLKRRQSMDLDEFQTGIYFIRMDISGKSITRRLTII